MPPEALSIRNVSESKNPLCCSDFKSPSVHLLLCLSIIQLMFTALEKKKRGVELVHSCINSGTSLFLSFINSQRRLLMVC